LQQKQFMRGYTQQHQLNNRSTPNSRTKKKLKIKPSKGIRIRPQKRIKLIGSKNFAEDLLDDLLEEGQFEETPTRRMRKGRKIPSTLMSSMEMSTLVAPTTKKKFNFRENEIVKQANLFSQKTNPINSPLTKDTTSFKFAPMLSKLEKVKQNSTPLHLEMPPLNRFDE